MELINKIKALLILSRIPFLIPGLAPFTAGLIYGLYVGGSINLGLIILSYIGLSIILLATYYSNEYFDYEGDRINIWRNKFSGGSRALSDGMLPRRFGLYALAASIIIFSLLLGIYLRYYYMTRPYLLYLALIGIFIGVFYSAPPFRWSSRGVGEILIGISYGLLAVISGFYIITGYIDVGALSLSLPATFSVFSLIIVNEIPDYPADIRVSKLNLVARFGRETGVRLFILGNTATLVSGAVAGYLISGLPGLLLSIIILGPLSLKPIEICIKNYRDSLKMEKASALTILLNALSTYPELLMIFI